MEWGTIEKLALNSTWTPLWEREVGGGKRAGVGRWGAWEGAHLYFGHNCRPSRATPTVEYSWPQEYAKL